MNKKLQLAWKYLESIWYDPYYLAVYWSQNYNLDIQDSEYQSDIDFKCIIIPTLDDLVKNSKPISTVIEFEWWQIDIKDIRSYVESVIKCNVNFLEILDTENYISKWEFLREYLKPLMEEMGQFYLKACYGMILEKFEALRHPYPSTISKIEKFWYDPKQLHHILRLVILIKRYIKWEFVNFRHIWQERTELIDIKKWKLDNCLVDSLAQFMIKNAKELRDSYTIYPKFETKQKIIDKSYSIIYSTICQNLKK